MDADKVRFCFIGAGLWDGSDVYPDFVAVPRVPVAGEKITLPDKLGWWEVVNVEFDYSRGLATDPVIAIYCERARRSQKTGIPHAP